MNVCISLTALNMFAIKQTSLREPTSTTGAQMSLELSCFYGNPHYANPILDSC